jgi:2-succinyl-5-enolpyruvyl-6-hydroxy-3-cyclohexene-1-carboxylate synthase
MTGSASTELAAVLVDEMVRCGVREAVLAPGSRSAPLAFALHAADATGRIRLHVRIDERSAGFLALGLAKTSRCPVPVVTTSGTAAANLHPAVLEASESGIALLLLTADRPPALRATGASQTVDQLKLYGAAVRLFHEVGEPGAASAATNAYWRALVVRAVATATGTLTRDPGPVHLNLAFGEPLVPPPAAAPSADATAFTLPVELAGRPHGQPWSVITPPTSHPSTADGWPARTLLVVGDATPSLGAAAVRLAQAHGWPVVAEPSSGARHGPNALRLGHLLIDDPEWFQTRRPQRLLIVGHPTVHRQVGTLMQDPAIEVVVVAATARWADSTRTARSVLIELPQPAARPILDPGWLPDWQRADERATCARDKILAQHPTLAEATVADTVLAALPTGALLVAGASMPVRELASARPRDGVTVISGRGAAGIDGTVSSAIGAALAWQLGAGSSRPAAALVGDLTFLHDSNGLLIGPAEHRPDLTIVVVNNNGGAVFALLEQGAEPYAAAFERIFGTPHGADLAAVCAVSGTRYTLVQDRAELEAALTPIEGLQVVEVVTDRSRARELGQLVGAAVHAAIS